MITKTDILNSLQPFESAVGKPVIVHTSLKAVGQIEGGAETLLSALIEFFTRKDGLFCVPTHTWHTRILDMNSNETCIGVFPTVAASRQDGVRSANPIQSMMVFGNRQKAEEFVSGEDKILSPTNPEGCHGKLYKMDGYVLLLGVGHTKNTYLHCVEEMVNYEGRMTGVKKEGTVIYKDGSTNTRCFAWYGPDGYDVSKHFDKFEPAFRHYNCVVDGKIGDADVQLCSARGMKEVLEIIYKRADGRELLVDETPLEESLYM